MQIITRKLRRILKYWFVGKRINISPLNDELTIVWRWRKIRLSKTGQFILKTSEKKRGFLIRRRGTFLFEDHYHDLEWYRRFVRLYRKLPNIKYKI